MTKYQKAKSYAIIATNCGLPVSVSKRNDYVALDSADGSRTLKTGTASEVESYLSGLIEGLAQQ